MTANSTSIVSPEVLRRLLLGRELLNSFQATITGKTDALTIARAIMTAQDAAEFILSAIAEHQEAERNERMGLPEYLGAVEKKTSSRFPGKLFFSNLNRARVSFKHHGILPNAQEFHHVLRRTEDYLEQACSAFVGIPLSDIDSSALIADIEARALYGRARELFELGKYREALEELALALEAALGTIPLFIIVGHPDTETALSLTAYSVDPSAFIRLQNFLPRIGVNNQFEWNTRLYGHPGNWTKRKVEFCLRTFVDLILKIQFADSQPSAVRFSMVFQDVLTANRGGVLVHSHYYHPFMAIGTDRIAARPTFLCEMKAGQQIKGNLVSAFRNDDGSWEECDFEFADTYVLKEATSDLPLEVPRGHALVVRAQDFSCSYEEIPDIRRHVPHLFE